VCQGLDVGDWQGDGDGGSSSTHCNHYYASSTGDRGGRQLHNYQICMWWPLWPESGVHSALGLTQLHNYTPRVGSGNPQTRMHAITSSSWRPYVCVWGEGGQRSCRTFRGGNALAIFKSWPTGLFAEEGKSSVSSANSESRMLGMGTIFSRTRTQTRVGGGFRGFRGLQGRVTF